MSEQKDLLQIKELTVKYVTVDGTVHAISNLNLNLKAGETLGLVGETGAGKTTTVKSVMGILPNPPAKIFGGEILFNGEDILKKSNKEMRKIRGKKISMIFQDPMTSLNPVITVGEQIMEVVALHNPNISGKEAMVQACNMLEMVGIKAERSSDYPHQFSGGMKQRVIIAMALACNPELLIADEPTTALDVTIQAQVLDLMKKLKDMYNTAMIMITHDLGIVAEICDNVAIMYAGEIVEYGSREHIFRNASHPYTRGLFACVPNLMAEETEIVPIVGLTPDPMNLPTGCRFHPRCPNAMEECSKVDPPRVEIESGHYAKCLLYTGGDSK